MSSRKTFPGDQWEARIDGDLGRPYFYNLRSGKVSWKKPRSFSISHLAGEAAPAANVAASVRWEERLDDETGCSYFYHTGSGEMTWDYPGGEPAKFPGGGGEEVEGGKQEHMPLQQLQPLLLRLLQGQCGVVTGATLAAEVTGDEVAAAAAAAAEAARLHAAEMQYTEDMQAGAGIKGSLGESTGQHTIVEARAAKLRADGGSSSPSSREEVPRFSSTTSPGRTLFQNSLG